MKHRLAACLTLVVFLGIAAALYLTDLSGIPDDGPVPIPMLPSFLFSVTADGARRCWALASLAYALPPLITATRSTREGLLAVLILVAGSWLVLPTPEPLHEDYVPTFTREACLLGLGWLLGLGLLGFALGSIIRAAAAKRGARVAAGV